MNRLAGILLVFLCVLNVRAQTDRDRSEWAASLFGETAQPTVEKKNYLIKFDFGPLWTRLHDNASVLGYIGDNFQRMRIVILTATKHPKEPDTYSITGKSMVKDVIRSFNGTMKITKASSLSATILEEENKGKQTGELGRFPDTRGWRSRYRCRGIFTRREILSPWLAVVPRRVRRAEQAGACRGEKTVVEISSSSLGSPTGDLRW